MTTRSRLPECVVMAGLAMCTFVANAGEFKFGEQTVTVADDHVVELAAGPPLVDRPITCDVDERGRLYVAESSGSNDPVDKQLADKPHRVLRLEDADGDGRYDRRTIFADKLMLPQGTMWLAGSLYVSAAPSIWKLTDTDDDGVADRREEWFRGKTLTGCANDLHGPYRGRDGWIYWCKGAFAEQTYDLPNRPGWTTRAAHLFRAKPDGSSVEPVMTGGMDNPVDVVFTPEGERILSCTFFQHPGGGHRDGLIHALYGGVYGKDHDVLKGHVRTGELMPVLTHLGPAAPCGLHYYESRLLGEPEQGIAYHGSVFACEFNLRRVSRHQLVPHDATFTTVAHEFLSSDNADFHPTDVIEDRDGTLLVCDTGGWYKLCCPTSQFHEPEVLGAIYRIRPAAEKKAATPKADRVHAVWSQSAAEVQTSLGDAEPSVRHAASHVAGLHRDRAALQPLCELLRDQSPAIVRAAAEALGRLGDPKAVEPLLVASRQAKDRVLEHSIVYALVEIGDAAAVRPSLAATDPSERRAALVALSQLPSGGLTASDVLPELTSSHPSLREAAWWIARQHDDWGDHLVQHFTRQLHGPLDADQLQALAASLAEMAGGPAIQRLIIATLNDAKASTLARHAALRAIALSRVSPLPETWIDALASAIGDPILRDPALATLQSIGLSKEHRGKLRALLIGLAESKDATDDVCLTALSVLGDQAGSLNDEVFARLRKLLTAELPLTRSAASRVLANAKLSGDQRGALAADLTDYSANEITQLLPLFTEADDVERGPLIAKLNACDELAAVRRDALTAFVAKLPSSLAAKGDSLLAKADASLAARRVRLDQLATSLGAGDPLRGRAVFLHKKTACIGCHAMGYVGGQTGPDLSRIGQIRTDRDLLEAVLYPSASFVRSYEPVMISTTAGKVFSGILKQETPQELVLATGPITSERIARDEVEDLRPSQTSLMPDGFEKLLSPQELADLIAYLKAAK